MSKQHSRRSILRPMTIRTRLLVSLVLIAMLPAIGISAGSIFLGYTNGRQQALRQLESAAALKDQEIQSWIGSVENELDIIMNEQFASERASIVLESASNHRFYDFYLGAMRSRFQYYTDKSRQMDQIQLMDTDGRVVVSTDPGLEGKPFSYEIPAEAARWGTRVRVIYTSGRPEIVAYLVSPVYGREQQLLGYVAGRINLAPLATILSRRTGLGESGKSYLAGDRQTLILPDYSTNLVAAPAGPLSIGEDLESHTTGSGIYNDYSAVQVAGVYHWQPDLQMMLITDQNLSEAFLPVYNNLKLNLGIGLLGVLLAITVALLLTRDISNPLVALVKTATQVAGGDLNQSAPVGRADELGALASAFNSMTAQLRDLFGSLERRVQERTAQLQDANQALVEKALQLETSAKISRQATSILNLDRLLSTVVNLICDAFGAYRVLIYLEEPDGKHLALRAWSGDQPPGFGRILVNPDTLNGAAASSGQPVLVDDLSGDPRYRPDPRLPDTRSMLVIPLQAGDRVIGTLDVLSAFPSAFAQEEARVIQSLGDQVAVAIQNAWLYDRSRELAVLEERNRLARELHDSVTQSLYSLWLLAEGWRRLASAGRAAGSEEQMSQVSIIAQQALKEMRLLVYELRPAALEQDGLLSALHRRLDAVEKRAGVEARLVTGELGELPQPVEEGLYWIAQEALNNSLKHANARSVSMSLNQDGCEVVLEIRDDGQGFELESAGQSGGMGLNSMRERAARIGGTLEIHSQPSAGTQITARIPVPVDNLVENG